MVIRIYQKSCVFPCVQLFWWECTFSCKPLLWEFQKWGWCYYLRLEFCFPLVGVCWLLALLYLGWGRTGLWKKKKCIYERELTGLHNFYGCWHSTFAGFSLLSIPTYFISQCFFEIWAFVWCIFRRSWIEPSFKMSKVCFFSCSLLPHVVWHLCNLPQHMLCCLRSFLLQEMF